MYVTSPTYSSETEIYFSAEMLAENSQINSPKIKLINAGHNLFHEGDDADYIYEVIEGVVRSSKVLIDGRRQVLNFGYPGETIGLSHDNFYHSDCDAVSDVKVRVTRKNAFSHDMTSDPIFCAHLLKKVVAEVNHMQEHFMMLGLKTATEKLASFLVAIMDRQNNEQNDCNCFDLPMKRCDIADFLGLTIETVSRNLTKLRKMGIIELQTAHSICVCKPNALRELAEIDI